MAPLSGSTPSITATPDEGFYFTGWLGEGVEELNALISSILMTEDRIATAIFSPNVYTLSFSGSGKY